MKRRFSLERQMLTYFGLIAAASLLITVEFTWAIQTTISGVQALTESSSASDSPAHTVLIALGSLRGKAILMGTVQAVVTLIILVMFIRRITGPLQEMAEHTQAICDGDLTRTIPIRRQDEIGLIGDTINGLTSNIQEIVALGLSTESTVRPAIEALRDRVGQDAVCREQLAEIDGQLSYLRDILESFKLFPAPLTKADGEKTR